LPDWRAERRALLGCARRPLSQAASVEGTTTPGPHGEPRPPLFGNQLMHVVDRRMNHPSGPRVHAPRRTIAHGNAQLRTIALWSWDVEIQSFPAIAIPQTAGGIGPIAINERKSMALQIVAARMLTTEQFASALQLNPQTLRKRLSQTGSYFGVRPTKLPNRRLRWPAEAVQRLLERDDSPVDVGAAH
jgi:hypothetical protein